MLRSDWSYRRGDIYLADLGEHRGHIQGGIRPVINIQNNSGQLLRADADCCAADNGTEKAEAADALRPEQAAWLA